MTLGDNNDIYVECIHKTEHHLKGLVVDENNLPLPYANVTLLNPADSTMVGGGVTNESGRFVIPNDHSKVIARITYVGYKPTYLVCSRDNVGTIKMQLDNFTLDGVTVKGSKRLTRPTDRGLLANVQGTVLEQFGSVTEMLSHLPLMMADGTIAGHGTPEIYINNKKDSVSRDYHQPRPRIRSGREICHPSQDRQETRRWSERKCQCRV